MTPRRARVTVGVWLVLSGSLWATDSSPALLVLAGIVAAIATSVFAVVDLGGAVVGIQWPALRGGAQSAEERDPRVAKVRRRANEAVWRDPVQTHSRLVDLVDDRLMAHHHIDRAVAPEEAMALMTPTLNRLVEGPLRRSTSPRELRRILSDIEAL